MSNKVKDALDIISSMTLIEIVDLNKEIEKKFNIDISSMAVKSNEDTVKEEKEEKSTSSLLTVTLIDYGSNKINVIKAIREIMNLGLKEAKDFVEKTPNQVKSDISKDEAEELKGKLESAGAKVEIK